MNPQELQQIRSEVYKAPVEPQVSPSFDPHDVDLIAREPWEAVLEKFTEDMDPFAIDLVKLADRFKKYVEKRQEYDLEVPGKIILLAAMLLKMKADIVLSGKEQEDRGQELYEEEDAFLFEDDVFEPYEEALKVPEKVVFPAKRRAKRKVTLDELKGALGKALTIKKRRRTRQKTRSQDYGLQVQEKDIKDRLDNLFGRLKGLLGDAAEKIRFNQLLSSPEKAEKINRFIEVLHLESEEKVRCVQEEFLGDIEIIVQELEEEVTGVGG